MADEYLITKAELRVLYRPTDLYAITKAELRVLYRPTDLYAITKAELRVLYNPVGPTEVVADHDIPLEYFAHLGPINAVLPLLYDTAIPPTSSQLPAEYGSDPGAAANLYYDNSGFLTGSGILPWDSGLAVGASAAQPFEHSLEVARAASTLVEYKGWVEPAASVPAEYTSTLQIVINNVVDYLAYIAKAVSIPFDSGEATQAASTIPYESAGGLLLQLTARLPVEFTATIARASGLPVENKASVPVALAVLPADFMQMLGKDAHIPAEWQGLSTFLISVPVENTRGIRLSPLLNYSHTLGVGRSSSVPFDISQALSQGFSIPVESLGLLGITATLNYEATATGETTVELAFSHGLQVGQSQSLPFGHGVLVDKAVIVPWENVSQLIRAITTVIPVEWDLNGWHPFVDVPGWQSADSPSAWTGAESSSSWLADPADSSWEGGYSPSEWDSDA